MPGKDNPKQAFPKGFSRQKSSVREFEAAFPRRMTMTKLRKIEKRILGE